MNRILKKGNRFTAMAALAVFALAGHESASAEADWRAITWDNDAFAGTDNGYSAGLFYSWFDTVENNKPTIGWLASTMAWSLSDDSKPVITVNAKTIGLTMMTPEDIELEDPPEGDLPYTGMLFYSETFLERYKQGYADKISATIGIVGEYSFAEETQTELHKIIGSDEPEGWDTQTDNEIVFQFTRARIWQSWKSASGNQDFLFSASAALGTVSSYAAGAAIWRYGKDLDRTYATMMLSEGRASNPLALEGSWYTWVGFGAMYVANSGFGVS